MRDDEGNRRGQTIESQTWVVEFRALPSDIPAAVRYRAMLKDALRRYKLRAVVVRNPTDAEAAQSAAYDTGTNDRG